MIDILVGRRDTFAKLRNYKLHAMLRGLEQAGIAWRVIDRPGLAEGGVAAFMHVDLTDVPDDFQAAARRYARCVNRNAVSIRKTLYSRARVSAHDDYIGPVICKTVLNSRGMPELRYDKRRSFLARAGQLAGKIVTPGYKQKRCPEYVVYESIRDVPSQIWNDPRMIVERFLPGSTRLPIIKHRFNFFYEVEMNHRVSYDSILCDPETMAGFDVVPDVPAAIRDLRAELRLDYGAIDYFMVEDEAIPIDANKTVTETASWVANVPSIARHMDELTGRLVEFARNG
jgi:hypothetical protein